MQIFLDLLFYPNQALKEAVAVSFEKYFGNKKKNEIFTASPQTSKVNYIVDSGTYYL